MTGNRRELVGVRKFGFACKSLDSQLPLHPTGCELIVRVRRVRTVWAEVSALTTAIGSGAAQVDAGQDR